MVESIVNAICRRESILINASAFLKHLAEIRQAFDTGAHVLNTAGVARPIIYLKLKLHVR